MGGFMAVSSSLAFCLAPNLVIWLADADKEDPRCVIAIIFTNPKLYSLDPYFSSIHMMLKKLNPHQAYAVTYSVDHLTRYDDFKRIGRKYYLQREPGIECVICQSIQVRVTDFFGSVQRVELTPTRYNLTAAENASSESYLLEKVTRGTL